jgi:hypothetical protein
VHSLHERLDAVMDENVTLKLRLSELEGDLVDERHSK